MNQYFELRNGEIILFLENSDNPPYWTMKRIIGQLEIFPDDVWDKTDSRPDIYLKDVVQEWVEE